METTSGAVEEGSFPDSADNLQARERTALAKQAEIWLRIDGLLHRMAEWFAELKGKMAHWSDRGPRDYETEDQEHLRDLVRKTVRATVEIQGGYHESGNGSSPSWRNWVMTMLGTLVVIGITGLIAMYANQKAMGERMDSFERRITHLELKVWP